MFNKKYFVRKKYIDQIVPYINQDIVKVVLGQRRTGKSYLLYMIIDKLLSSPGVSEDDILYINKEDLTWDAIKTYTDLHDVAKDYRYVLIDEVDKIQEREKAIASLKASGKHDIYITGSNSEILEGSLATLLSGRYITFNMYPLDYNEFLQFHKLNDTDENLQKYFRFGGIPLLKETGLTEHVWKYMEGMYNTIFLKDIIERNKLRKIALLASILKYIAQHIGSLLSASNISKYYKQEKIAGATPNNVIDWLYKSEQAHLIQHVSRYDLKGKTVLSTHKKRYYTDIGLRNYIAGGYNPVKDIEKVLENVVFCHLKSHGYELLIGDIQGQEIDFIAKKQGRTVYVQVCYRLDSEDTRKREFGNLQMIQDDNQKIVISMDSLYDGVYDGIEHIYIRNFLTSFH